MSETLVIPADPWQHRFELMRCSTCMWYVQKSDPHAVESSVKLGRCRRRSPTLAGFPTVFPADWCGDHKLDETKIGGDAHAQQDPEAGGGDASGMQGQEQGRNPEEGRL